MRRFQPERVPKPRGIAPFDPAQLPAGSPLDVEVGCGVGLHPIRYVQENPDRFLIAIEHTRTRFDKFASRLSHHRRFENLMPVHADAVEWITHFLSPDSVDRYFFLYPNPYPKPKDANKRWAGMPFMEKVLETLKPGGTLEIVTNEEFYAQEAQDLLTRIWKMELVESRKLRQGDLRPRTHFEKKYLSRGETCHDLILRKPASSFKLK